MISVELAPPERPAEDPVRRGRRFGRVALLCVVGLLAVEIGLRALMGGYAISRLRQVAPGDGRCMGLRPSARIVYDGWLLRTPPVEHVVNAQGFRGPERTEAKAPNAQRIALLGDSFTFGLGVGEDVTIGRQLEAALRTSSPGPVEVLNFGMEGINLEETLAQYRLFASRWEHDTVLYLLSPNDLGTPACTEGSDPEAFGAVFRNVYVARLPLLAVFIAFGVFGSEDPEGPARLDAGLDAFAAAAAEHGASFGLVVLARPFEAAPERLAAWSERTGTPVLDVEDLTLVKENLIPSEGHFNALGSRRIAERIAAWLRESAWGGA